MNDNVIALDDILLLKRRSGGATVNQEDAGITADLMPRVLSSSAVEAGEVQVDHPSATPPLQAESDQPVKQHRLKRRRIATKPLLYTPPLRMSSPEHTFVSDEDCDGKQYVALDLTKPAMPADEEVLAGCSALLELASHGWD